MKTFFVRAFRAVRDWLFPPVGRAEVVITWHEHPLAPWGGQAGAEKRMREILAELIPPRGGGGRGVKWIWETVPSSPGWEMRVARPVEFDIQPPSLQFGEYIRDLCINDLARELGIPPELLDDRPEPQLGPFNGFCRPRRVQSPPPGCFTDPSSSPPLSKAG